MLPGEARAAGARMSPARAAGVAGGAVAGFASAWAGAGDPDVAGGRGGGESSFKVPPVGGDALRAATHGETGDSLRCAALQMRSWARVCVAPQSQEQFIYLLNPPEECRDSL